MCVEGLGKTKFWGVQLEMQAPSSGLLCFQHAVCMCRQKMLVSWTAAHANRRIDIDREIGIDRQRYLDIDRQITTDLDRQIGVAWQRNLDTDRHIDIVVLRHAHSNTWSCCSCKLRLSAASCLAVAACWASAAELASRAACAASSTACCFSCKPGHHSEQHVRGALRPCDVMGCNVM